MGKYEIAHLHDGRMKYNSYHKCECVIDAIIKHESKGYDRSNIRKIVHHTQYTYSEQELKSLLSK